MTNNTSAPAEAISWLISIVCLVDSHPDPAMTNLPVPAAFFTCFIWQKLVYNSKSTSFVYPVNHLNPLLMGEKAVFTIGTLCQEASDGGVIELFDILLKLVPSNGLILIEWSRNGWENAFQTGCWSRSAMNGFCLKPESLQWTVLTACRESWDLGQLTVVNALNMLSSLK